MLSFNVTYKDNSIRVIPYSPYSFIGTSKGDGNRKSFTYIGPVQIEVTPHFIVWLNNYFLPYFNTNPILWAISVSTCPEELQPYLILPDEQLTYKGTANE